MCEPRGRDPSLRESEDCRREIIEPITGSNGVFIPPKEYMTQLRAICDKYGMSSLPMRSSADWAGPENGSAWTSSE